MRVMRAQLVSLIVFVAAVAAHAQGGPPLLTDDPGTAEYKHWEINLAVLPDVHHDFADFELPLADFNYGATDHTQLKFEIPLLLRTSSAGMRLEGGDGNFGIKWRFVDQKTRGFDLSMY